MATEITEGYALSPQQERVWLLQQGAPGMPYRTQGLIRVEGPVDLQVFTAALQQVIERHEVLRTTFQSVPGMTFPVQVIGPTSTAVCQVDDVSGLSAQDQAARVEALWREACQRPFDCARDPLLHLAVARLAPTQHAVCISLPALCADRTTFTNLVHELSRTYAACVQGETLADVPTQYVDVSAWQSALLTAEAGAADRAYWRQHSAADLLHVTLPGAQPRSSNPGFAPCCVPMTLQPDVVASIDALVQQDHTSAATFFLACWTVLLWRHLGQTDMLIGTAGDGRNYEPLTGALGLLTKYLPMRCAVAEHEPFSTLLTRLHDATHEAYHRQEYFAWESGGHDDDGTGPAFFPLCFEWGEQPAAYAGAGVAWVLDTLETCTERFTVKLACVQTDGALSAAVHYDAQVLQRAMITSLVEQLQTLLASAVKHPEAALGQLEILSDAERHRVLVTFNQTQTAPAPPQCLHHLFEAQAARIPDSIAVVCAEQSLTYAALNARANQLAHHLHRLGVGLQTRVGICLPRSLEMLVGVLGILKAGGAYVPLDPTYPRERLAFMVADVQAPVLLTQARILEGFPAPGPHVVCLDTGWDSIAQEREENALSAVTPEHLAYVIYTSGSTGQPKGVLVTHRNVVHSTQARGLYYRHPVASFLLLSSLAFDSSVAGLFWTLAQGGMLVLPSEGQHSDLGYLTTLIAQRHVSHVLSLPSLYALLLEQMSRAPHHALHTMIVAGEACPRTLVARHHAGLPDVALYNEYGPTEGTVWSSVHRCQEQDESTTVPIGRPIANVQIYLLNPQLQPVPVGVTGELYIGGTGVTAGYGNRAAFTAERFLPHLFSDMPGARLYKTGDLGRYRPDGTIEFLGRIDHQVKIRGFRIELGEIEAALHAHPGVADAVVVARAVGSQHLPRRGPAGSSALEPDEASHEQRLIAYLVPRQDPPPSPGALRRFLQAKLPDYMVPALFVWLEALPLAPNGKIDHQALSEAEELHGGRDATYVMPGTEAEHTIARVWQEVLRVDRVGIHDNFFDLGGHSLAMVQVHSTLQEIYSRTLSLIDMFQYPTISALAKYVSQEESAPSAVQHSEARAETRREAMRRHRHARQERRHE